MTELATAYRQAGDETSARTALEMATRIGEHFDGAKGTYTPGVLVKLVGLQIQRHASTRWIQIRHSAPTA
jgi:hypothetical protein